MDKIYFRPNEVEYLKGSFKKINRMIGWKTKVKLKKLIKMMIKNDLRDFRNN